MESNKDDNIELFQNYSISRTDEDFEKLFNANTKLIYYLYRRHFNGANMDDEEVYSIGSIALYKAIESFDMNNGVKFSTYASRCIINAFLYQIKLQKKDLSIPCLDAPLSKEDADMTLKDTLVDESLSPTEEFERVELTSLISSALNSLTDRERQIVSMKYGIGTEEMNATSIAKKLNISKTYVSSVLKTTMYKLRRIIKLDGEGIIKSIKPSIKVDFNEMSEEEKTAAIDYMIRLKTGYPFGKTYTSNEIAKMFRLTPHEVCALVRNGIEKRKRIEFQRKMQ